VASDHSTERCRFFDALRARWYRGLVLSASQILHEHAGSPSFDGASSLPDGSRCWLCGAPAARGLESSRWQGANFTDQNKGRGLGSEHICEACAWACSWTPPPGYPPQEPGKKGVNLRLFSHFWNEGSYLYLKKDEKQRMLRWLVAEHEGRWFAAIADSGQKHTLPWTPVNYCTPACRGLVWFEERVVQLPGRTGFAMVFDIAKLMARGVTKTEIETAGYAPKTIRSCVLALLEFENKWGSQRGGAWFSLAIWLAQKEGTP